MHTTTLLAIADHSVQNVPLSLGAIFSGFGELAMFVVLKTGFRSSLLKRNTGASWTLLSVRYSPQRLLGHMFTGKAHA